MDDDGMLLQVVRGVALGGWVRRANRKAVDIETTRSGWGAHNVDDIKKLDGRAAGGIA